MARTLYVDAEYFNESALVMACNASPWCEVLFLRCCALSKQGGTNGIITPEILSAARVPSAKRHARELVEHGAWDRHGEGDWAIRGWGSLIEGKSWRPSLSAVVRRLVFGKTGGRCHWCGGDAGLTPEIDHVVPVSRGGSDELENLVLSCRPCNRSKGSLAPEAWIALLGKS